MHIGCLYKELVWYKSSIRLRGKFFLGILTVRQEHQLIAGHHGHTVTFIHISFTIFIVVSPLCCIFCLFVCLQENQKENQKETHMDRGIVCINSLRQ